MSAFATGGWPTQSDCWYYNPCNNVLKGRVRFAPEFGSFNANDVLAREWMPQVAVQVVCELDEGQQDSLDGDCIA
jgi:hypothetical protein